jgi:hypothetical protein
MTHHVPGKNLCMLYVVGMEPKALKRLLISGFRYRVTGLRIRARLLPGANLPPNFGDVDNILGGARSIRLKRKYHMVTISSLIPAQKAPA